MNTAQYDRISFSEMFDNSINKYSAEECFRSLQTHFACNRAKFKESSMWLARLDILASPVIHYLIEIRDSRKIRVTHKDFLNTLDMHKIAEIVRSEQLSDDVKSRLEGYLERIQYHHYEAQGEQSHEVQNFCMKSAIELLFE
ncbi:hypothetical protein RYA05_06185 [Pseudomonas syringae pv. actinidiae]|nr:hypothetical protein [Pseudomonas syringae pv. actinidiae]